MKDPLTFILPKVKTKIIKSSPVSNWPSSEAFLEESEDTLKLQLVFFFSFGCASWHVEVPRPGTYLAPQKPPEPLQWQCWIINPLDHKGTPSFNFFSFTPVSSIAKLGRQEIDFDKGVAIIHYG